MNAFSTKFLVTAVAGGLLLSFNHCFADASKRSLLRQSSRGLWPRALTSPEDDACTCGNGKAKIWGPGGPHTALIPAADLYNAQLKDGGATTPIEICKGPESTWRETALECAGGLMTAAEQQVGGFMHVYNEILDTSSGRYGDVSTALTMHYATLLVHKGNPKGIKSLLDIANRDDVGLVVVDGNYHDTLTSGTGLWEDVIGRTGRLEDTANLRNSICAVGSGGGSGRDLLLNGTNGCDAWIYWNDWAVANPDLIDEVPLTDDLVIYRDLAVMPTTKPDGVIVQDFIDFVMNSTDALEAMEGAGWSRDFSSKSVGGDTGSSSDN